MSKGFTKWNSRATWIVIVLAGHAKLLMQLCLCMRRSSWTRGQGARLRPEPLVDRDGSVQRHVDVAAVDIDQARGRLRRKIPHAA